MRLSPLLLTLVCSCGAAARAADEQGIPYQQTPAEPVETPPYHEIPADRIDPAPLTFVEIPPDRFSGGTRDGRTVYREMDHDDFDDEPMVETPPARDPGLHPLPATVVPVGRMVEGETVVVPVDRVSTPRLTAEDRIFQALSRRPEAPGSSSQVPAQERVYIPPDSLRP